MPLRWPLPQKVFLRRGSTHRRMRGSPRCRAPAGLAGRSRGFGRQPVLLAEPRPVLRRVPSGGSGQLLADLGTHAGALFVGHGAGGRLVCCHTDQATPRPAVAVARAALDVAERWEAKWVTTGPDGSRRWRGP